MQSRNLILTVAILVYGSALTLAQAPVDSNVPVSGYAQGRGQDLQGNPCATQGSTGCGGCYPQGIPPSDPTLALLSQLNLVDPEWQPIGPMIPGVDASVPPLAVPILVSGTVGLSKSPGDDFPGTHISPDYNAEIIPDDNSKLATGNTNQRVEFEWEGDKLPVFAWPGEGDRILPFGRWIFDCGHADPGPNGKCSNDATKTCIIDSDCSGGGTCSAPATVFNYQSEMHPPQAVAVIRTKSNGKTPATRADVFISGDAGGAGDRCTVTHLASAADVLATKSCFVNHCSVTTSRSCLADSECAKGETCIRFDPNNRLADINAADFTFDLPLPPQPPGATKVALKHTEVSTKILKALLSAAPIMPNPTLVPDLAAVPPVVHVTVPMTVPINGKLPNVFAQSITASWKGDTTKLTHVQVKFTGITVNNPVKEGIPAIHAADNVSGLCTDPAGGLTTTACTATTPCPKTGTCAATGKACNVNGDCKSTDFCQGGSTCVGGPAPGWRVWGEVNGDWVELAGLGTIGAAAPFAAPPYAAPATPFTIKENFKFDEYLPSNGSLHIKVSGRSLNCENVTLFGQNLKDNLKKLSLIPGADCLLAVSHDPGTYDMTYSGPNFGTSGPGAPMTFDVPSDGGDAGTCSVTTSRLCIADGDCPSGETCNVTGGAFRLHYTVAVLP
jgi:hypothetical protein